MADPTELIRKYLDLVELSLQEAKAPQQPVEFGVTMGSMFADSLKKNLAIFPDLKEKLQKFLDTKRSDPLHARYGKHDGPFKSGTPLAGFMHCHLRDDAVLIYTLKNRNINLILICNHADMEGKNTVKLARKLNG